MSYAEVRALTQLINIDFSENGQRRSPLREDFFRIVNTEKLQGKERRIQELPKIR